MNNCKIHSLKEIGQIYKKSSESIRTNLFDYENRPDLVDLFYRNSIGFGIKLEAQLISESKSLITDYLYSPNLLKTLFIMMSFQN